MRRMMSRCGVGAWAIAAVLVCQVHAENINVIQFDYSLDTSAYFTANPGAKTALETAGHYYENILNDSLSAISPYGNNTWTASITHPTTGVEKYTVTGLTTVPANTLIVYVGARSMNPLGEGGPGSWGYTAYDQGWVDIVSRRQEPAGDFGPWGGSISFSSTANWNYDLSGPVAGKSDFYSVALHELGHVLGLGTSAEWNALCTGLEFNGPAAKAANLANPGQPVPLANDGYFAHWDYGIQSKIYGTNTSQEAAMDPDLTVGTRKLLTDLDVAGLRDIGWDVKAVPEPSTVAALVSMALMGAVLYWRRLNPK